ncbi:MAG: hypothetical protein ACOC8K_09630, partial [Gemmatimonadota bacterium]
MSESSRCLLESGGWGVVPDPTFGAEAGRRVTRALTLGAALVVGASLASGAALVPGPVAAQSVPDPDQVTAKTVERWMDELSNEGRWGEADEKGTLNLITPEVSARAAALVEEGISVSLSHDYVTEPAPDATT